MKVALANGLLGLGGSFGIGLYLLSMSAGDIVLCVFASIVAAVLALIFTLKAVKFNRSTKGPNIRLLHAWMTLTSVYLGLLFLIAPPIRNFHSFLYLIFPLILASGFSILIFGPIQDYLVATEQKKRR